MAKSNLKIRVKNLTLETCLKRAGLLEEAKAYRAERTQFHAAQGAGIQAGAKAWQDMHDRYVEQLVGMGHTEIQEAIDRTNSRQHLLGGRKKSDPKRVQLDSLKIDPVVFKAKTCPFPESVEWVSHVIAMDPGEIDFTQCPSRTAFSMLRSYIDDSDSWWGRARDVFKKTTADKERERRRRSNPEILEALEADKRAYLEQRKREDALVG